MGGASSLREDAAEVVLLLALWIEELGVANELAGILEALEFLRSVLLGLGVICVGGV